MSTKRRGERERQQEAREHLDAGLGDPQLLDQLGPVAVGALRLGLLPVVLHVANLTPPDAVIERPRRRRSDDAPSPTSACARRHRSGCAGAGASGAPGGRARADRCGAAAGWPPSTPSCRPRSRRPGAAGPVSWWNLGSDSATPGVSAQPGWVACTPIAGGGPPAAEQREQLDLGPLAARVGRGRRVLPVEVLRVVGSQSLAVHPARGHEDHPAVVAGQPGLSSSVISTGPSTCSAMVSSWPCGRLGPGGGHRARVVHEHVDPVGVEVGREAAYVVEVGDVAPVDARPRRRPPATRSRPGPAPPSRRRGPPGARVRPRRAHPSGGREAEAGRRAGHRGRAPGQRTRLGVGRPAREPAAHGRADPGEPRRDGAVHRDVHAVGERLRERPHVGQP